MNIRELVLDMLLEIEKENVYSHILIRNVLDKYDYLKPSEKSFIKRATEGVLERRIQLDYILDSCSSVPVMRMKPFIRNLLRMSVYQLLFMDKIPDRAVCDEAVKLAVKRKFQSLKGFVNGVLRNIARHKGEEKYPDRDKQPVQYFSVFYSMPEFLVKMWIGDYGEAQTERMLEAMLEVRPVTVRMNEMLTEAEREALLERMERAGIEVKKHSRLSYACELSHVEGVRMIPGFEEGLITVQDVSSMLCVESAGIKEGDFVLDVCAAPGGKAVHAAIKLNGTGSVLARDITPEKTALIGENVTRQRLSNIEIQCFDARLYDEGLEEMADVVLADLPCSGLGILGRKRDIKYRITEEGMAGLVQLQREILNTVWRYVRPGGVLLYSTCTIHRKENEDMAEWFAGAYPFELEEMKQLLPGVDETDGFFIARFRRR